MTCSLVVVFERAATAWEIVVNLCRLPTVRAPGGAFVRLAARARETRVRQRVRIFILAACELISSTMLEVDAWNCRLVTLLYFDRTSQNNL